MAKKSKASGSKVTVADLAAEYGLEGRRIRMAIRAMGIKAPEVPQDGFGPKSKYEWTSGSKELKKIRTEIEKLKIELEKNPPKPRKKKEKAEGGKKSKKSKKSKKKHVGSGAAAAVSGLHHVHYY